MPKKVVIIGGGIAGLSASACLAKAGFDVKVLEKNAQAGGRARQYEAAEFKFDMGPSWYWMPDIFESFYNKFGHTTSDFYDLKRLDPSYRVFFGKEDFIDLPADSEGLYALFESLEKDSSRQLKRFLEEGRIKYEIGMRQFAFKPGLSFLEFADPQLLISAFRLHMFKSISRYIRRYFTNPRIIQILEFPVLFLGAKPERTPALYSMMNYADMELGTWYPMGGMVKIIDALEQIAKSQGVTLLTNETVAKINVVKGLARSILSNGMEHDADVTIAGADYHHVEQQLLETQFHSYSPAYWDSRELSPSCLIFYIGLDKKINKLLHHNLFFDTPFDVHLKEIFDTKTWPSNPLFYVCCPSKTDREVAPVDGENLFVLIPVSAGLNDSEEVRKKYFELVMQRLALLTGENLEDHIVYSKSYAHSNYLKDYNAFKGNAFGLANTLRQTAVFKPAVKSKKVSNLFFTGQLTVPGPGVPPSLISGQVVANEVINTT